MLPAVTPVNGSGSPRIAIIGAGFSGIGMAIRLKQAGLTSFTIYEAAPEIGGTWFHNSYPGAACDIGSHLYSFSFKRNHDWTKTYAGHEEILEYLKTCMREEDLYAKTRLSTPIASAVYDDDACTWTLTTDAGEQLEHDVVIFGCGQLNEPVRPDIPGLDVFAGRLFHSARWDHDYDLKGKRVAVIGNGASAAQFVPEVAKETAHLTVCQRSNSWIVPRRDFPYSATQKRRFRRIPGVESLHRLGIFWFNEQGFLAFRPGQKWWGLIQGSDKAEEWQNIALRHLAKQVPDPELRARLTPDYGIGCKRVLLSNDWYPTLQREDVDLVTDRITRVTADSIETESGTVGPLDAIILGTGFDSTKFMSTVKITGSHGLDLATAWADGPQAHLGITVAGFPNLFMLYGPNTNLGHGTIIFMIECQIRYIRKCVQKMQCDHLKVLTVDPAAQARFNDELQQDLAKSVWASGCASWYVTSDGKVLNNWSGFMLGYWRHTLRPDFDEFITA